MKSISILVILLMTLLSSCHKEETISASKLPSEIRHYVSTHFPENKIIHSVVEKEFFQKSYDLILDEGFKLEFDGKNNVTDIDGHTKLPDSVIPEKIRAYVTANYPDTDIVDWELDDKKQQIKLNIGLELEFTMNGDFIRIDS